MEGFFGIGFQELVMIAVVALIVLGPERLPATLREVAKFIRQIRNLTNEFTQQFGDDFKALEDLDPRRMLQQAINSIDEEEQAKDGTAKGKTTSAKTTTPAKPTPAKATTAKTTTTSTTSTTTTKPSTPVVATAGKSTAVPSTKATTTATAKETAAKEELATDSTATPKEDVTAKPAETPETEQRILPPAVERSVNEQNESSASTSAPTVQTNGASNETYGAVSGTISAEGGSGSASNTNGNQDHTLA